MSSATSIFLFTSVFVCIKSLSRGIYGICMNPSNEGFIQINC